MFYKFSERNIKAPWRWCSGTETWRGVYNTIFIYACSFVVTNNE